MTSDLWTDKHKPITIDEIAGQNKAVNEILSYLSTWKPGKALFLHGSPGIGKNLMIETIAKERGYLLLQLDASDKRSKNNIEEFTESATKSKSLFHDGKFILIDEADGISGRSDRGAVVMMVKLIKESRFPVFVIANDPWKKKLKPLRNSCKLVKVDKLRSTSIEKRMKEICTAENIEYNPDSLKNLARWAQGDMRSAINDLQMICSGKKSLTDNDMESLGFRERGITLFNILPTIFHSKRIKATSRAIWDSDKDPDEVIWWIEQNIPQEMTTNEGIIKSLDVLSKADMFRSLVSKQQNWRFKAYMVDMISSVSLFKEESHGFISYKPPKKFTEMMKAKFKGAAQKALTNKMSVITHKSTRAVKRDYLPYLKIIARNSSEKDVQETGKNDYTIELDQEDLKFLNS